MEVTAVASNELCRSMGEAEALIGNGGVGELCGLLRDENGLSASARSHSDIFNSGKRMHGSVGVRNAAKLSPNVFSAIFVISG